MDLVIQIAKNVQTFIFSGIGRKVTILLFAGECSGNKEVIKVPDLCENIFFKLINPLLHILAQIRYSLQFSK